MDTDKKYVVYVVTESDYEDRRIKKIFYRAQDAAEEIEKLKSLESDFQPSQQHGYQMESHIVY